MRIHPVNYLLARLLKPFYRIAFRAVYKVSISKISSFIFLDPHELTSLDPWFRAAEEARVLGQRSLPRIESGRRLRFRAFGKKVSLQKIFQQKVLHEISEGLQFNLLVQNREKLGIRVATLFPSYFHEWVSRGKIIGSPTEELPPLMLRTAVTDRLWDTLVAAKAIVEVLALLFRRRNQFLSGAEINFIFAGISPGEVPKEERKLDFRTLTKRGLLDKKKTLYILPQGTNKGISLRMQMDGYLCATRTEIWSTLSLTTRFRIAFKATTFFLNAFLNPISRVPAMIAADWIRALPWLPFLAKHSSINTYLSTASAAWPEMGEVAVFNACEKRTVNYWYSCNPYDYSIKGSPFRGMFAKFGVSESQEVWVWNELHADFLREREVYPKANAKAFRSLGPFMYGEAAILQLSPAEVRKKYGIHSPDSALWVSLFDIPTVGKSLRMTSVRGPNSYPIEMLDAFFRDVIDVFSRFERVHFLIKPKRSPKDRSRDLAPAFEELLAESHPLKQAKRLHILEHDADPYLGIAAADFSIGLPFSSPVFAAIGHGRAGLFYDPLDVIHAYWPHALDVYLRRGKEALNETVQKWCSDPEAFIQEQGSVEDFPRFTGPQERDPAEIFREFLIDPK